MTRPAKGWTDLIANAPESAQILIVEDEPELRGLIQNVVERLGYGVKTAGSAEEADSWMNAAHFDLVLLDLGLPRMSGLEFLSWVLGRLPDLAVIILSGSNEPELAMECIDRGARTFLVKPFDTAFLRRSVRDALMMRQLLVERNRLAAEEHSPTSLLRQDLA